jgi:hypothetical protein
MNPTITAGASPEEEELAEKQEEIGRLKAQLPDRELFLTNLRVALSTFEAQYLRRVGTLYADIDEWTAKFAQAIAREHSSPENEDAAERKWAQARESRAAVSADLVISLL